MMNNKMELVFILDKSGSMRGLESDTIGGFNSLLEKQKQKEGSVNVTTVLFSNEYEKIHDRVPIQQVSPLTLEDYFIGGSTALLDAIGITINDLIKVQKRKSKKEVADKVLVVIITDGRENASQEYTYRRIKKLIEFEEEKYGWEFLFLGANIDAAKMADNVGIRRERATNYHSDKKGTSLNFEVLNKTIINVRETNRVDDQWKRTIEKDYKNRKENK